jgi:hypothetical protein
VPFPVKEIDVLVPIVPTVYVPVTVYAAEDATYERLTIKFSTEFIIFIFIK